MTSEPRASLREEQKNLTRDRLLDAAIEVLFEKTIVDATMEDIAKAAGVTRVTVYAHFPGKVEIVHALAERMYSLMGEAFAELAAIPRWTRAEVRGWLDRATEYWREMTPVLRVVRSSSSLVRRVPADARDRYTGARERYVSLLLGTPGRWQDVPPAQATQRATMVVLQTESFLTAWLVAGIPMETDDPLELLADALCYLLDPALDKDS
ncbi:TetR/AcrR family transcriptional regulator [Streptomyces sp. CA-249302]|uniref:TetR/AcrR family transcriptional regulator n=1 Tax=Streptomyces sp. CA-249302 TaxID=3240058 RepID=UPI003D89BFD9